MSEFLLKLLLKRFNFERLDLLRSAGHSELELFTILPTFATIFISLTQFNSKIQRKAFQDD